MSFAANATPLLAAIVEAVAPAAASAECPCEAISERKASTIRLRVARELFGKVFRDSRTLDAYLDGGGYAERSARNCRLSQELLPLDGIGRDSFFLNEHYADEGPKLSGFTTLRSWDEYTHHMQEGFAAEEGRRKDGPKPYVGRLLWDWARWLEGGRLVYGNLSVASSYLAAQLEGHAADMARSRYPTEWSEGPEHGKRTDGGLYKWDMLETPAANGTLRFAAEHLAHLVVAAWAEGPFAAEIAGSGIWVVRKRREEDGEVNEDVVFSGVESMDRTRFRNWLEDLSALPDGSGIYEDIETRARAKVAGFMEQAFKALEDAAAETVDLSKDDWRDLCSRAAHALRSHPEIGEHLLSATEFKQS